MEAQVILSISQNDLSSCPATGGQVGLSVLFDLFDEPEKINLFLDSIIPYIPYSGAVRALTPLSSSRSSQHPSALAVCHFRNEEVAVGPVCCSWPAGLSWTCSKHAVQRACEEALLPGHVCQLQG